MSVYTISPCLFQCEVQQWAPIIANFISNGALKIALDRDGRAIDQYKTAPIKENKELVISCLDLITKCNKYEHIAIDQPTDGELFFEICANTVGSHELIVQTKQAYPYLNFIGDNTVEHKGTPIVIYDKDEAAVKLKQPAVSIGTVSNSIFTATGNVNHPNKR